MNVVLLEILVKIFLFFVNVCVVLTASSFLIFMSLL